MVGILANQHMRQKAGNAWTDNTVHHEPAQHIFQLFRHIFGYGPTLAATYARFAECQNLINPGQFGRQRLALRFGLLPFGITVRSICAGNRRCRCFFFLQAELKLIQAF